MKNIISFICADESRINCFLISQNINIKYNKSNILCIEINNNEVRFILDEIEIRKNIINIKNANLNKKYIFYVFSYNHSISINNNEYDINYFFSCDNESSIKKIKEISKNNKIIILPCSHPTRSTRSPCDGTILSTKYYAKGNRKNVNIEWKYYLNFYEKKEQCRNTNFLLEAIKIIFSELKNNFSKSSILTNRYSINSTSISNITNKESIISNSNSSEISNLSNTVNNKIYKNNTLNSKQKIKYYYILGAGCSKNTNKNFIYKKYFLSLFDKSNHKIDVEIICKNSYKSYYTIAKRLIGKPPSNSSYLLNIQNNILDDLKKYKEVIACGHSYGGSLIARIAKNLNKNNIKYNNLKMYTFGSIYIPQKELNNINIINFMNFSDVSLRLIKTNYENIIKNKNKNNFEKKIKKIRLPYIWNKEDNMKYIISNNKQIFYISINSDIKSNISKRAKLSLFHASSSSMNMWEKEWKAIHNEYYKITYSILNSENFRNEFINSK
jgi:hypothetical protein